jgi:hypothetical protein
LKSDEIKSQIRHENILEVYLSTKLLTNMTEMKIRMKNGEENGQIFKAGDTGLLLGELDYADKNARDMTDGYVAAITKQLQKEQSPITELGGYCGGRNENDAVFCKKCGRKIA